MLTKYLYRNQSKIDGKLPARGVLWDWSEAIDLDQTGDGLAIGIAYRIRAEALIQLPCGKWMVADDLWDYIDRSDWLDIEPASVGQKQLELSDRINRGFREYESRLLCASREIQNQYKQTTLTGIDVYECHDCGAPINRNIWLDWESAPLRSPWNYVPLFRCGDCGYGANYRWETLDKILKDNGIDINEVPPGEKVKPGHCSYEYTPDTSEVHIGSLIRLLG